MVGEFASGARRATGWRGTLAKAVILLFLFGIACGIVVVIIDAIV
jgi:hypothetical protein